MRFGTTGVMDWPAFGEDSKKREVAWEIIFVMGIGSFYIPQHHFSLLSQLTYIPGNFPFLSL